LTQYATSKTLDISACKATLKAVPNAPINGGFMKRSRLSSLTLIVIGITLLATIGMRTARAVNKPHTKARPLTAKASQDTTSAPTQATTIDHTNQGYDIKMDLTIDGKKVSSPQLSVKRGETASVTQETSQGKTVLEVTADEGEMDNHKGILMKFSISSLTADGTRTVLASPQILAVENERAEVTVGNPEEKGRVSLSVSAKRKIF